jgi:hypothetical protein
LVTSNRGGFGRPPAVWLSHEFVRTEALTIEDIAHETGEAQAAIGRLISKYANFLRVEHHVFADGKARVHVKPVYLRQLYSLLSAEFGLKKAMRANGDGRDSDLRSAFSQFLKAARRAGYDGRPSLEDRLPRTLETISDYYTEIKAALGLAG